MSGHIAFLVALTLCLTFTVAADSYDEDFFMPYMLSQQQQQVQGSMMNNLFPMSMMDWALMNYYDEMDRRRRR